MKPITRNQWLAGAITASLILLAMSSGGPVPSAQAVISHREIFRPRSRSVDWQKQRQRPEALSTARRSRRTAPTGSVDRTLRYAGATRTYRLHLPDGSANDSPLPLVIVLHGLGATGPTTETLTKFSEVADQYNFAVAYPNGINKAWRYWDDEDPGFIIALADALISEGIADARRLYVTGISNGAYLTNVIACDYADRIAVAAAVAGTMTNKKVETCQPARSVPVLYIHGTDDPIVGYDGKDSISNRYLSLAAEDFVQWWAEKNRCETPPVIEKLPNTASDGTSVERYTFLAKQDGPEVIFHKIIGGGHTWPGGSVQPERLLGKTCRDFSASQAIWEFASKYQLK